MKKIILAILICLISITIYGQQATLINLGDSYLKELKKNNISIVDSTNIYVSDGESKNLYYYSLVPRGKITGTLILLPSTGETIEDIFNNNVKLVTIACDSNLLIVTPTINYNLCLDQTALNFLNTVFSDVLKKYNPPLDKFIIGGFSLGGMNAIRYTEMAYESNSLTIIKPRAVYGVDPPLDYINLYYTFSRTVERNFSKPAVNEATEYIKKLNYQFGNSPDKNSDKYILYSMYSRNQTEGGNAKYLKNVPVRIYSDPDIDWQMKNRHADYYDMNALDQTAMINQLHILGNDRAEFINALGKGYRLNGMRHPHSWSIVEPVDCINWIMKCLK